MGSGHDSLLLLNGNLSGRDLQSLSLSLLREHRPGLPFPRLRPYALTDPTPSTVDLYHPPDSRGTEGPGDVYEVVRPVEGLGVVDDRHTGTHSRRWRDTGPKDRHATPTSTITDGRTPATPLIYPIIHIYPVVTVRVSLVKLFSWRSGSKGCGVVVFTITIVGGCQVGNGGRAHGL